MYINKWFLAIFLVIQGQCLLGQSDSLRQTLSVQVCNPVPEVVLTPGSVFTTEFYVPIDSLKDTNCSLESYLYMFYIQNIKGVPLTNIKVKMNQQPVSPQTPICEIPPPYPICKVNISGTVPKGVKCGELLQYQFVFETFVRAKNIYVTLCSTPLNIRISPCAFMTGEAHLCNEYETAIQLNVPDAQKSGQYVWKFDSPNTDWLIDGKRGAVVTNTPSVMVTYVGNKNSSNSLVVSGNKLLNQPSLRLTKSISTVRSPEKLKIRHIDAACGYMVNVVPVLNATQYEWGIGAPKPDFKTSRPEMGTNVMFSHGTKKVIYVRARNECGFSDWYFQELKFPVYPADHGAGH
ncbi:MAG: hypothetical protein K1X92_01650 [Bacteroidia bacterium]|nr:hypothetical protein [Bacteroidia bacterium]